VWARFNDDTRQGLGRIARLDLIGNIAVTIRDYGTIVHKRKLILELTDFQTNCPPRWLALYGVAPLIAAPNGEVSKLEDK
jgi:hypothetical protein